MKGKNQKTVTTKPLFITIYIYIYIYICSVINEFKDTFSLSQHSFILGFIILNTSQ